MEYLQMETYPKLTRDINQMFSSKQDRLQMSFNKC